MNLVRTCATRLWANTRRRISVFTRPRSGAASRFRRYLSDQDYISTCHVARCSCLKALEGHGRVRRPAHPIT
jgi:hypothetical protein